MSFYEYSSSTSINPLNNSAKSASRRGEVGIKNMAAVHAELSTHYRASACCIRNAGQLIKDQTQLHSTTPQQDSWRHSHKV